MLWIGRQGGRAHNIIVDASDASSGSSASSWDPENKVGIKIGFPMMEHTPTVRENISGVRAGACVVQRLSITLILASISLQMWLDAILPQAAVLAETSGDRSCRVSACELLHSAVIWMIGTNASRPIARQDEDFQPIPTRFHKILKHLLPVAIRLAVSAEPVAEQLFEPLVFTLIHWLTR